MATEPEPISIEKDVLLLVEGIDERNFFEAFFIHLQISNIQIMPVGGKDKMRGGIKALAQSPGFENVTAIGIVRDSDNNHQSVFDSIRSSLESVNLKCPKQSLEFTSRTPKVGVMILPLTPMGTNRMLEDLCLQAVIESGDAALECVDYYFACLKEKGVQHAEKDIAKARLHAFLASRSTPDLRLGEAARKGYWDWKSAVFAPVEKFLQQLATD